MILTEETNYGLERVKKVNQSMLQKIKIKIAHPF